MIEAAFRKKYINSKCYSGMGVLVISVLCKLENLKILEMSKIEITVILTYHCCLIIGLNHLIANEKELH